jgi:hypothetical protein
MTTAELISAMTQRIVLGFNPLRVILFGSQARGDAGRQSDYARTLWCPPDFIIWDSHRVSLDPLVETSYQEVTSLFTDKKPKLETLAQMLLEKEMVEGAELEALLNGKAPEAVPAEAPAQQPA